MSDEIIIDSEPFISSKRASELIDYTQDYIGQLARGGQIKARRVGGLWYVSMDSLQEYKEQADSYRPEPPPKIPSGDPESLISFDGKDYVSAIRAAKITGYTSDYVGQLARARSVAGRQVGNRWYVEREGILAHKKEKDTLLWALQSESVGLKHKEREEKQRLAEVSYAGAGPFFDYKKDEHALMPEINEKSDAGEEGKDDEYKHAIPIHVMPTTARNSANYAYSKTSVANMPSAGARNSSSLLLTVAATIVIVLSVGVVSLKNSSVYTLEDSGGTEGRGTQTTSTVTTLNATISVVEGLWGGLWDSLEKLLVPELVYHRPLE